MKYCPKCDQVVNDDSDFCPKCGSLLKQFGSFNGGTTSAESIAPTPTERPMQTNLGMPSTPFSTSDFAPSTPYPEMERSTAPAKKNTVAKIVIAILLAGVVLIQLIVGLVIISGTSKLANKATDNPHLFVQEIQELLKNVEGEFPTEVQSVIDEIANLQVDENTQIPSEMQEMFDEIAQLLKMVGTILGVMLMFPLLWQLPMALNGIIKMFKGKKLSTGYKVAVLIFMYLIPGIALLCFEEI